MRFIIICTYLLLAFSCSTRKSNSNGPIVLNGSWTPVKQEIAGKELPPAMFQNQKLVINDSTYKFTAESVDKGIITFKNGKMDIFGKEGVNAGKHFTAIYKLDNGQLTICYNLRGDTCPVAFETKSSPALFLSSFKKD